MVVLKVNFRAELAPCVRTCAATPDAPALAHAHASRCLARCLYFRPYFYY
jgi:hypothetical protein